MRFIMGTGSRSVVLHPDAKAIYDHTEKFVLDIRDRIDPQLHLISGMAEGWDEMVALIGLRNEIPYSVFIPTRSYGDYYWRRNSLTKRNRMPRFQALYDGATARYHLEDIYGEPMRTQYGPCYMVEDIRVHANFLRNSEMIKMADSAIVYDAKSSGTRDAVAKLKRARKGMYYYPFESSLF